MNNTINNDIVYAFQNGEKEAFKTIYNHYYKRIYFFAFQHCSNEDIANDIVQNTFVAAYSGINSLKHVEAFHSWLYRIAYNELANMMKKENIQTKIQSTEVDQLSDQPHQNIHKKIKDRELSEIIIKSISTLSPKLKSVVILHYYEELSIKEISFVLHIPSGTVKSRLNRANKIIQKDLSIQGVTPASYTAGFVITPTLVMNLINSIQSPANIDTSSIDKIIDLAKSMHKPSIFSLIKGKKTLALTTILLTSSFVIFTNLPSPKTGVLIGEKCEKPVLVTCQFATITYDTSFTNASLPIDITTTNDDYDQILINGLDTRIIDQNGTYQVTLLKDGNTLDQRELVINNIDKLSPKFTVDKQENTYIIHFKDDTSGLDPNSILYYLNDILSNNYTYDIHTNTLTFNYMDLSSNEIIIKDLAGNEREVLIKSNYYNQNN